MSTVRKAVGLVAGAFALWVVVLAIFGALYGGRAGARVASRIAASLAAEVTIDDTNLKMVRGGLELSGFKVRRDDLGHLAIDIAEIECDLPPLGLMLVDRVCRDLVIERVRLEVSSLALFRFKRPKHRPVRAERVELRDARLVFSPSAFVPELGKIAIAIDHVVAGPTTFKTPVSWIFSLRELEATLELPAGVSVKLRFKDGVLRAWGGVLGSTPVELPLAIPVGAASDDAQAEIQRLVELGRDVAEQIVKRKAKDWIRSKLPF